MLNIERTARRANQVARSVVGPTRVNQIMSQPAICLDVLSTARDAAELMCDRKIGAVPVVQAGQLIGLLTETDLVRWLAELGHGGTAAERLLEQETSALMRSPVVFVAPTASIADVIGIFRNCRVRHVPVVADGNLVGMISDRDVRRALGWSSILDQQADIEQRLSEAVAPQLAREIMHPCVLAIDGSLPLRAALLRMREARVHSLPVLRGGRLAGILTQTDFVKAIAREELL